MNTWFLIFFVCKVEGERMGSTPTKKVKSSILVKESDKPTTPTKLLEFFLIGDSDAGKSAISQYYCEGTKAPPFRASCGLTLPLDFKIRRLILQSTEICVRIWDSYRRFDRKLDDKQMERIDAFLLVFSVKPEEWTRGLSLEAYIDQIREKSQKPIYIIGNKTDLLEEGDRSKYFDPWERERLIFSQISSVPEIQSENILWTVPRELILKILRTAVLVSLEECYSVSISRNAPLFFLSCLSGENADKTLDFIIQETAERKGFITNPTEQKTNHD